MMLSQKRHQGLSVGPHIYALPMISGGCHHPVIRVYVDPTAVVLPSALGPAVADEPAAPGACEALEHLIEAGCDVVLLGDEAPSNLVPLPEGVHLAPDLPDSVEPGAWFLTAEPYGRYGRPHGTTTVLVGPKRPPGRIPLPRFDLEARDLPSAVMEILTHQAMS
jgi:hypothetical protein